tara:strand:+ start:1431 stop:1715 length:285 start_codon:yes stop_codon:yes gene_type:complete
MLDDLTLLQVFKDYEDPELHLDIWTLGLIYDFDLKDNKVKIKMTFTSPMCPFGPKIVNDLKEIIKSKGAEEVEIEVTFDPPWEPSDELREMLGV